MRLIDPPEFARRYFDPQCAPDLRTIRSWVEHGLVPGRVLNTGRRKQFWIDAEAWEQKPSTGNLLADKVLSRVHARGGRRAAA